MQTKQKNPLQKKLTVAIVILTVVAAVLLPGAIALRFMPQPPPTTTEPPTQPPTQPPATGPYRAEDFQEDAGFLTYLPGESRMGIDVSGFQGKIDWQQVKQSGISFVFIRVGGRGYGEKGTLYYDDAAQGYYEGAKAAGLQVGVYFFSQALNPYEARQEAWFLLDKIHTWELDFPVVFDWEWVSDTARTANMEKTLLTHSTMAFCNTVRSAGFDPMIYFNYSQGQNLLDLEQLRDYGFWLALYDTPENIPYAVDCWQYSCTGTVPGIEGSVDLNLYFP